MESLKRQRITLFGNMYYKYNNATMEKCKMVSVFTSGYVNMETILHFFYKITNERGMKTVFTYSHVKWFYGQSEHAYYLHYFIILFVVYFARLARNFATSATSLSALKKSCTVRSELKFY